MNYIEFCEFSKWPFTNKLRGTVVKKNECQV